MKLTAAQQEILDGKKGETLAKVMKTLVMYGEAFDATKMVEVTSNYNHLVTSFGLGVMNPVYELMDTLLDIEKNYKGTVSASVIENVEKISKDA